jgi:hypothetical protein
MNKPNYHYHPFQVPELLARILSFNDQSANARCARVCKAWMDISLDNLWSEVDGLKALVRVMLPLNKEGDYWVRKDVHARCSLTVTFRLQTIPNRNQSVPLSAAKRFKFYATRIESFNILPLPEAGKPPPPRVHRSVLTLLSRTFGGFVFPNLQSLTIHMHEDPGVRWFRYLPLFFSSRLKSITISYPTKLDDEMKGEANVMTAQMAEYAKSVEKLVIAIPNNSGGIFEEGLGELVPKLTKLEHLSIHNLEDPGRLLPRLKTLKKLKLLQLTSVQPTSCVVHGNTVILGLTTLYTNLPRLMDSPARFATLRHLRFSFMHVEDTNRVAPLLSALPVSCPMLELLFVDFAKSLIPVYDDSRDREPIRISALRHLQKLPRLASFSMSCTQAVELTDNDLVSLVAGWPSLMILNLVSVPTSVLPSRLTINVLPRLARLPSCRLIRLAIYARTSKLTHTTSSELPALPLRNGLSNLSVLSFGHSPITPGTETGIANYLRQLLPPKCKIGGPLWASMVMQMRMKQNVLGEAVLRERRERERSWEEVGRLVQGGVSDGAKRMQ